MRLRKSIFTRLFIIVIMTGLVIEFMVGGFFRQHFIHSNRDVFNKNISIYTDYIISDLGIPPDLKRAEELAGSTLINIAVNGPSIQWSTAEKIPDIGSIKYFHQYGSNRFTWHRGAFILVTERNSYRYIFFSELIPRERRLEHFFILIALLATVLIGAYLLMRRTLRPIKDLTRGVKEIAGGNLDYQVPVKSRDELGELTRSFNSMRKQISDMLSAKEQLLLDVSHELRSPLTRMKVALEFVEEGEARESISEEIRAVEAMISEILESERLKNFNKDAEIPELDLVPLAGEAARQLGLGDNEIRISMPAHPVVVRADRERIKMVIRNVLENGAKYSNTAENPLEVTIEEMDDAAFIRVRDHGSGIPADEIPSVFEPFYRIDSSRSRKTGGYGLGLSLCKKIMEAHGGSIEIESGFGDGTTVLLRFRRPGNIPPQKNVNTVK